MYRLQLVHDIRHKGLGLFQEAICLWVTVFVSWYRKHGVSFLFLRQIGSCLFNGLDKSEREIRIKLKFDARSNVKFKDNATETLNKLTRNYEDPVLSRSQFYFKWHKAFFRSLRDSGRKNPVLLNRLLDDLENTTKVGTLIGYDWHLEVKVIGDKLSLIRAFSIKVAYLKNNKFLDLHSINEFLIKKIHLDYLGAPSLTVLTSTPKKIIHVFITPLRQSRIPHKVSLFSEIYQAWIQSFLAPRPVTIPKLKNLLFKHSWR